MSDMNINNSQQDTSQVFGSNGTAPADATNTMTQVEEALQQLDSIKAAYHGSLYLSNGANTPILGQPKIILASNQQGNLNAPPTTQEHQTSVNNLLTNSSDYLDVLNGMLKPSPKVLSNYVSNYVQQKGGTLTPSLIEEALAQFVQDQTTSENFDPQTSSTLLNTIRLNLIKQTNPEIDAFVEILKNQYIAKGLTPQEAQIKAQNDALNDIDNYMDTQDMKTPVMNGGPAVNNAIVNNLSDQISGLDPQSAQQFVTGLFATVNVVDGTDQFLANAALISPTPQTSFLGPAGTTAGQNVAASSQELITQTLQMLQSLNLPNNSSISIQDYLKIIGSIINLVQSALTQMQIMQAQKSSQVSQSQTDLAQSRYDATIQQIQDQLNQVRQQEQTNKIMSIVMPIVGALIMLAGILAAPFTGGVTLAITIAVSVSLFATMTALQQTGVLQQGMQELSKMIQNSVPANDPQWEKDLAVIGTYLAVIIIAVVVIVATRGTAGSLIANMVCMTIISTMLASSDMIQRAVSDTAKAVKPNVSDEEIAIATAVITAVLIIALSVVSFKCAQTGPKGSQATGKLAQIMGVLKQGSGFLEGGAALVGAGASIYQGKMELDLKALVEQMGNLDQAVQLLTAMIQMLKKMIQTLQSGGQSTQDQAAQLAQLFNSTISGLSDDATALTQRAA